MKRGTDWGDNSDLNARDEEPQGPLAVERLTPQDRRRQFGWRVPAGLLVTIALVALATRAVDWYETSTQIVPAAPTPISWVNAIVSPATGSAELATQAPSGQTAQPSQIQSVTAEVITYKLFWTAGEPNHFTVQVTNTTSEPIPLTPCPTYSMYVLGTPANLATVRAMNCAEMGLTFEPGETMALDMIYTPSSTDPLGLQTIEWEAVSGFRATAQMKSIEIEG